MHPAPTYSSCLYAVLHRVTFHLQTQPLTNSTQLISRTLSPFNVLFRSTISLPPLPTVGGQVIMFYGRPLTRDISVLYGRISMSDLRFFQKYMLPLNNMPL